ncbi:MAG: restriction endonuclease subunit S [Polynucleobacter sp.]|uniref:restriction endonuclease subunit S n=1 Tax=Polynucleobacter sp. TaxID=2029855 RepID=UPI002724E954|nr:restriction endonuclease subunit S [Polynucleobacter sp.]MDO8714351.1 restriction endonuclease subunit S [Polynucleobacter sp.]
MAAKVVAPKLRFKEGKVTQEKQWSRDSIGNLFNVVSGGTPSRANQEFFQNGKHPWVRTTDLNNGFITTTSECLTDIALRETSSKMLPEGTVVVAMYGGFNQIGRTGLLISPSAINQALSAILPNLDTFAPYFLLSYLNYKVDAWKEFAASSRKDPNITKEDVKSFELIFPDIKEQTKIANFLTAVDSKISQLTKKHGLLTLYKKGVMQKIFSQELRLKDDEGREFAEWSQISFADIANINMGQSPDSSTYNQDSLGLPLIQGNADIVNRKTSPRAWTSEPTKKCNPGDLILTVRAPVGAIAKSSHAACIGRGVCAITAKENVSIEFLYQLLFWFESYKWKAIEQGSTFTAVSGEDIRNLNVMSPVFKEQTKIANFLTAIDDKITNVKSQLEAAKEYKQGLLQQMFV